MMRRNQVLIGTSGWHYPHWKGVFYPAGMPPREWLGYYCRSFATVEVNNFFYQLPSEQAVRHWRETAPDAFVFTVKASRYITHLKKLREPEKSLPNFLGRVGLLGSKAGPILVQLPAFLKPDPEKLDAFLQAARPEHRWVFEFRNSEWFQDPIYSILSKHGAAFCIYDLAGRVSPRMVFSDTTYVRLHGPKADGPYQGDYPESTLRTWAEFLMDEAQQGRTCYCYFNNDQAGFAVKNALQLKNLLT